MADFGDRLGMMKRLACHAHFFRNGHYLCRNNMAILTL
jgi:hypothetical protein